MGHRFHPHHVDKLMNPERQKMLPPDSIVQVLDVQKDHQVADVGCGPGYFTIPLAKATIGTVYGVDVSPEMLDMLRKHADEAGVGNIAGTESPAESIALPSQSVERILCSLVLHEVDDLARTLGEFKRILRPRGKVLLIEWEKKPTDMGPPVEERLEPSVLSQSLEALGFRWEILRPNSSQYMILAEENA